MFILSISLISKAFAPASILARDNSWHLGCLANTCDRYSVRPMKDLVGPVGGW
jgi:hypothetical protein